jgi:UDP-N-acetylglucosamine 2-epimerase (non-hydrolysing)
MMGIGRRKRVLLVFGTRPEAIKMAPVMAQIQARASDFDPKVCVTGQHREMLDQVLELFQIRPAHDLRAMRSGQSLEELTARVLVGVGQVLEAERPDVVLVHGDTTSSTAAALAAFYRKIPVGHVEAGLRTRDRNSPFPEEMNRQLTARLADLHFAPTSSSRANLLSEGIPASTIHVTGNTVIDALTTIAGKLQDPLVSAAARAGLGEPLLRRLDDGGRRLLLVTGHRRENFGPGFERVCRALAVLAERNPQCDIVYPVHLNPNVREPVHRMLGTSRHGNVHLLPPLEYLSFVYLMKKSVVVITDSGGIQEEAPALGKPVLVTRHTTERPEAIDAGTARLVGTDTDAIVAATQALLTDADAYLKMSRASNPYGDGHAAARIAEVLAQ